MAIQTVLFLVSQASMEIGIAQAMLTTVVGSGDQDVIQMKALLNTVADELLLDEPYATTLGDGVWLIDRNGVPKPAATADDDRVLFDERLAIDGLKYRFLKAKGLEFGEEMRDFLGRMNKLAGIANGRVLDLNAEGGRVA
jgi:hypothetical protein